MKVLCLSLIFLATAAHIAAADPIDKIAELIGKGNIHELAGFFAPNVDLTLMGDVKTCLKAQAEANLQKFFSQNKPLGSKMLHKVNSGSSYRFGVVIINTDKGAFRVAFTLKADGDSMQIIEIRIESEKVK